MPWSEEGYVVDDNFNRVKVKTSICGCTPLKR
jgi:hypothetical protein